MRHFITLLVLMGLLYSCEDYDYYSDHYRNNGIQYELAFIDYVGGKVAENQAWGFEDRDINEGTRTTYPNSNMWEDEGYVVPEPITVDEVLRVKEVFAEKMDEGYVGVSLVDWDEFFVQHVYKGDSVYVSHAIQNVTGSEHMDWLCSYADKELQVISWWPYETQLVDVPGYDDHIYNFNAAFGSIQLMYNSTTKRFGFHCSEDSKIHYNFRMEKIDGAYYVGFDFEASGNNPNEQVDRDYVFDDWIVKICPGRGSGHNDGTKRIIVEDLVAQDNYSHLQESDWDYNDAVFDVVIKNGVAKITLLAAGGTLPLTVAGHEVHAEFGLKDRRPVNVNSGITLEPVSFEVNVFSTDINDIPVIVTNGGISYELLSNKGQAPAKICVGTDFKWCDERQHIKNLYPKFVKWATKNPTEWENNSWYK